MSARQTMLKLLPILTVIAIGGCSADSGTSPGVGR